MQFYYLPSGKMYTTLRNGEVLIQDTNETTPQFQDRAREAAAGLDK